MYSSNLKGFILAVVSSAFIGSSFIIKKKGLVRASVNGPAARVGGYGYLKEPLWWIGMVTMVIGELTNFVAYIYAPAVLVTPLGALSIIVSAVLAHLLLKERLQKMGMLGCLLCIVGSTVIVLHSPEERSLSSIQEIWELAIQPAFLLYTASVVAVTLVLMLYSAPRHGQTNILIYIGICSIIGSLTVMSIKAIGIAIKLTLEGTNQLKYFQTWIFGMVAVTCIITQLNYLNMVRIWLCSITLHHGSFVSLSFLLLEWLQLPISSLNKTHIRGHKPAKILPSMDFWNGSSYLYHHSIELSKHGPVLALDTFNTAIVSPIYYAMFTSFTIFASAIMFKDYSGQSVSSIASELCGFITVLSGTAILHSTREPDPPLITDLYTPLSPKVSWYIQSKGEWKQKDEDGSTPNFLTVLRQDYFK